MMTIDQMRVALFTAYQGVDVTLIEGHSYTMKPANKESQMSSTAAIYALHDFLEDLPTLDRTVFIDKLMAVPLETEEEPTRPE